MRNGWWSFCLILGLVLSGPAGAAQSKSAMVTAMMEKSGIDVLIESFPQQFRNGLEQGLAQAGQGTEIPDKAEQIIREASTEAFPPERVHRKIQARIEERLSRDRLAAITAFLDSELGRKMTALENDVAATKNPQAILQKGSELRGRYQEENPERLRQMEEFLKATGAAEQITDFVLSLQTAVATGISRGVNPEKAPSAEAIRKRVEARRFQVRGMMGRVQTAQFLYTYRDATNGEIDEYLAFIKTPAGQAYSREMMEIFQEVLMEEIGLLGENLGRRLREA